MNPRVEKLRARVLELRREGLSYAAIGKQLGMTMQRAWQLATDYRKPDAARGETVHSYLAKRKREHEAHAALMIRILGVE